MGARLFIPSGGPSWGIRYRLAPRVPKKPQVLGSPQWYLHCRHILYWFPFFFSSFSHLLTLQLVFPGIPSQTDVCMHAHHVQLFVTPWTVACQSSLSLGFSGQEYRGGLPFLPPGDLPNPGIKPISLASPALQVNSLLLDHWGIYDLRLNPCLKVNFQSDPN